MLGPRVAARSGGGAPSRRGGAFEGAAKEAIQPGSQDATAMASSSVHIRDMQEAVRGGTVPGRYAADPPAFTFPMVVTPGSRGGRLLWTIRVRLLNPERRPVEFYDHLAGRPPAQLAEKYVGEICVTSRQGDGKTRDAVPTYVTRGKNLGRASATNVITQAMRDALGKYNRRAKDAVAAREAAPPGEAKDPEQLRRPPPMLLQKYGATRASRLGPGDYPNLVLQEKLNGVRLVMFRGADGAMVAYGRKGDRYLGLSRIRREARQMLAAPPRVTAEWLAEGTGRGYNEVPPEEVRAHSRLDLDGELFLRGRSLRWISGQARREDDDGTLQFHVFDVFFPEAKARNYDLSSEMRQQYLARLFEQAGPPEEHPHVVRVPNHRVRSLDDAHGQMRQFIAEGGEGVVLRINSGGYHYGINNYHSPNVIKLKATLDDEFTVVGYRDGKGKMTGQVIWECELSPAQARSQVDRRFTVVPKNMTRPERKAVYQCLSQLVPGEGGAGGAPAVTRFDRDFLGRQLTVEYAELSSKTGKPTQPWALGFRQDVDPIQRLHDECGTGLPPPGR